MRSILMSTLAAVVLGAMTSMANAASPTPMSSANRVSLFPAIIDLPNGFQPEGVATAGGSRFFVGSLADGAIFEGNLITGQGRILVPGEAGRIAVGLEVDRRNRIFVAGGTNGDARVYDAATGAELASYQFTPAGSGFVNDAVVTRDAAYFTDSFQPNLYVVPIGPDGSLGDQASVQVLPLSGDFVQTCDGGAIPPCPGVFNANGIEAAPDGRLLVVQSNTGLLHSVDAVTGQTRIVDLGGDSVNGDGLLLRGLTLYAVEGGLNRVAVVRFDGSFAAGTVIRTITDPALDVPTTVTAFGSFLYAVNARFGTPPQADTPYQLVRLPAF